MIFLFVAAVAACLVFIFGRIVDIYTKQEVSRKLLQLLLGAHILFQRQLGKYFETTVMGDLAPDDTKRAVVLADQAYSVRSLVSSTTSFHNTFRSEFQHHMVPDPLLFGWSHTHGPIIYQKPAELEPSSHKQRHRHSLLCRNISRSTRT
jgi:hypothetical protein